MTYRDVHKVQVLNDSERLLFEEPAEIGNGGNSGFQGLNIAAQFGADRIVLVGFDMHDADGVHWHGRHSDRLNNPETHNFVKWRSNLNKAADSLRNYGIQVVNGSPNSALMAFPKMSIEQALKQWQSRR